MNTKNDLKWNRALWLLLNIQSSDYGAYCGESKPILYHYEVHSKFWLCLEVETGRV